MSADPSRFLTVAGHFTDDLATNDALCPSLVCSDLPHASIGAVDTSVSRSLSGVELVFTADDLDAVADALGSRGDEIAQLPVRSEEVFAANRSGARQDWLG